MGKDRDWVAGARLGFSRNIRHNPEAQEGHTLGICHDLRAANVQLIDTRQGLSLAAIFNVAAPSRRSADKLARSIMQETIAGYAGNIFLSYLAVVPRDEVHEMMLETVEHTWPEISRSLPTEARAAKVNAGSDEQLAEIIPLFPNLRPAAEVVSIFSAMHQRRP